MTMKSVEPWPLPDVVFVTQSGHAVAWWAGSRWRGSLACSCGWLDLENVA